MRTLVALGLLALTAACASGGSAGSPEAGETAAAPRRASSGNRNVLTSAEVKERAADLNNAFEAIERLRPDFLRARGPVTIGTGGSDASGLTVYINMDRQPNLESLRSVAISEIKEIRRYSASEASSKFGLNNMGGAIQVVTNAR